jgi:signal transduction histidine kinase
LHDEIGQTLTAAKINLNSIDSVKDGAASVRIAETVGLLDKLLRQVREISLDLHPSLLDDLGLVPALRSLLDQQARRAGLRAQLIARKPLGKLSAEIQTTAFRIAQEGITNILRHAKAKSIRLHLQIRGHQLQMRIVDDGIGFNPPSPVQGAHRQTGFGLISMRERATLAGGDLQIVSGPGKGTTVEVSLPLRPNLPKL